MSPGRRKSSRCGGAPRVARNVEARGRGEDTMPPDAEPMDWDFPALVDAWNLYGLPALLVVVGVVFVIRHFTQGATERAAEHGESSSQQATGSRRITVRTIALIHLGLA